MKCYYEELGIARDANDGDIKTAYRKLALRWHPDKNPDNLVEAKEKFQTLQQAYEVLSDQHERAWYDNHREQILRGKNSDYEENCLDLFQYFTVSCFKGYGDDDKGFYKTYAEVFEKISAEDAEFMDDDEEIYKIPKFGDSTSSYDDVVGPFYAYWQSYCTKKTYTWLCPHDITEIKDRRVLRYIEKDMKKIVQKAKRERNEEVRNLVSFIRKRDKRVQANKKLLEEKAALNRIKQEQNRLEQIRKRNREIEEMRKANGHAANKDYEDKLKLLEQDYGESIDSEEEFSDTISDGSEDLDHLGDLYCVACNKTFTNANAFLNHETSKKHKDNIERLKREMQDEEKSFEDSADQEQQKIHIVELDDLDELDDDFDELTNGLEDLDSELDELVEKLEDLSDEFNELDIEEEEVVVEVPKTKTKKNKKGKKAPKVKVENEELEVQATEAPVVIDHFIPNEIDNEKSGAEWGNVKKSTKKSKNKKAQKKTVPDVLPQVETIQQPAEKPLQKDGDCATHSCVTCKSTFPSKNKLFAHLKKTNHGVYIPKTKPQEAETQTANKKTKGKRK